MVRSPLSGWDEPDPVTSMDVDPTKRIRSSADIREFFDLWLDYDLGLDTPYTTSRIIEVACMASAPNDSTRQHSSNSCCAWRRAGNEGMYRPSGWGEWLREISGRVVR